MNLERNGTLKKQKKHLFLQKNQLTMNNFRKKMVYLQCCYKQAADMLRKQPCLVRTENLDNSLYTRTKTEVVHPTVYYCIHSASAGWVLTYTHWCELIFFAKIGVFSAFSAFHPIPSSKYSAFLVEILAFLYVAWICFTIFAAWNRYYVK